MLIIRSIYCVLLILEITYEKVIICEILNNAVIICIIERKYYLLNNRWKAKHHITKLHFLISPKKVFLCEKGNTKQCQWWMQWQIVLPILRAKRNGYVKLILL